jgi:hypothetical protein
VPLKDTTVTPAIEKTMINSALAITTSLTAASTVTKTNITAQGISASMTPKPVVTGGKQG